MPLCALLLISAIAWAIYAWVQWPQHWESRLMHPLLFAPWTIAWHCTARGSLARSLGWRLPLVVVLLAPVLAALGGEWIQTWWRAVGHDQNASQRRRFAETDAVEIGRAAAGFVQG